jgi:O-antigen ligase
VQAPGAPGHFGAMGFFTSRLGFGHVATVLIALLAGERRGGWFVALAAIVGVAAVGLTFDRGAWLGLCVAAVVIAPLLLAPLLAAGALVPPVRHRFLSAFSAQANPDRVFIWSRALEIIRDHPLRGVGFGNYQRMLGPYYDRVDPHFFMRTWAHNLELSTLAETGPQGLAAMLWIWVAAARALWQRRAMGGLAALLAWLAIAQVHDAFYDNKVMYALWFALGISLRRSNAAASPAPPPATAG